MQSYEIKNSNTTEDSKMIKIKDEMVKRDHEDVVKRLQEKIRLLEKSRNQRSEELKQAKVLEQELKESQQKLLLERDEYQKALKTTRESLEQEIKLKGKLQIEVHNIRGQINTGLGKTSGGPTYEQLQARNKELENDNIILQCQQKVVVVYNKESGTFEYIGEPIPLNLDREVADLDEFLACLKKWLARNERLTLKSIFESIDKENFGELSESKFDNAMQKIGVQLRQQEKRMIKEVLDPRNIGFYKYRPLVKELAGVPQQDF